MTGWTPSDWTKFLMRDIIVLIFLVIIRDFDVAPFFLGLVIGDVIVFTAHSCIKYLEHQIEKIEK